MSSNPDPKAQMRMNVIMRVQNREITATQGAEELGISRKTYYEWENRALLSLHKTLSDRPAGRPEKELNPYVEELENKVKNLSQQVLMLEQEREIRDILQGELRHAFDELDTPSGVQKKVLDLDPKKTRDAKKRKSADKIESFCQEQKLSKKRYLGFIGLGQRRFYRWKEEKEYQTVSLDLELEIEDGSWEGAALPTAPPPKPQASEPDGIREQIKYLVHRNKRSFGTTELYQQNKEKISRREFQKMVIEERRKINLLSKQRMKRIEWRIPSSCWAFDDTFYAKDSEGNKIWIHNIKDLASQYLLPPIAGKFLNGKEVAANLGKLFITHGAPLYLKADNGPNLNSIEVQQVLKRFQVIIVNSPEYYSKYNGSIEQANGLIKKEVDALPSDFMISTALEYSSSLSSCFFEFSSISFSSAKLRISST